MPDRLKNGKKLVGVKQSGRAVQDGRAEVCYFAGDAEGRLVEPLRGSCAERGVEVVEVGTMARLGELCGIDIGAAAAVLLKK